MNATVFEMKLDQDYSKDPLPTASLPPTHPAPQRSDTSALWEAIERLDNTVVNNTVKVRSTRTDVTCLHITSLQTEQS